MWTWVHSFVDQPVFNVDFLVFLLYPKPDVASLIPRDIADICLALYMIIQWWHSSQMPSSLSCHIHSTSFTNQQHTPIVVIEIYKPQISKQWWLIAATFLFFKEPLIRRVLNMNFNHPQHYLHECLFIVFKYALYSIDCNSKAGQTNTSLESSLFVRESLNDSFERISKGNIVNTLFCKD